MQTPTTTPTSTVSNPPVSAPPTQLDPDAVNLSKAIRQTESGGNFTAQGKSGEYGAYQFTEPTWNKTASKYGVNVPLKEATPQQQNEVAYKQIKEWKDAGHNVGQIASMWNSGEENPDAYKDSSFTGTNKEGAKFDVPAYAKSVATAYQTLKSGGTVGADPKNPSSTANTETPAPDNRSTIHKVFDWAFPFISDVGNDISGKSSKTALQQLGDLGLSALWFVPGLGEAGEAARVGEGAVEGGGLISKALAGPIGKGALTGYGADVSSNLSQGKTGVGALAPGLGTATGGLLGGALDKFSSKYGESNILDNIKNNNNSVLGQTKRGANDLAESFAQGKNTGELLASKGINLKASYNPETLAFDTTDHVKNLRDTASTLTDTLTEALKSVQGKTTVTELEDKLLAEAEKGAPDKITASEKKEIIQGEFSKIRAQYGEELSASDLNELKKRAWNESNFDASKTNLYRRTQRGIGNSLKTSVESLAKEGGLDGVKEFNQYIGDHLDAADNVERLNGTKVKGGRLGDLVRKHSLAAAGGVGGFFGGGPVGSLFGALAGEYAGGKISDILRKVEASPIKSAILEKMQQEDPEAVQKIVQFAKSKLEKGGEETAPIASKLVPKTTKNSGKVTAGLLKTGIRTATQAGS